MIHFHKLKYNNTQYYLVAKKKLSEKDFWAQQVIRAQQDGKDCIFALVRRRYSEDDIESVGPGEYFGIDRKPNYPKVTDNDPDSETYTQRIDKPDAEPTGVRLIYLDKFTPENIKKYKSMCSVTTFGTTQLIYKFKQISITADKDNEFWSSPQDEVYNKYILKETIIKIEHPPKREK